MKILSRPYCDQDRAQCLAIFETNIGLYFAKDELQDFKQFLEHEVQNNHYLVLYAENKPERILACGGCGELEEQAFLRWGMVDQRRHKRGLGGQLLIQRLKLVEKKLLANEVLIDTSQHVQGFYEKYGFEAISVIKDGFAPNIDKVRMRFSDWDHALLKAV
ncbi:MAG: GNAT family N-acetyltransferase [Gammaproteobacteria bacterium]|nr:GNAT family N-acetyltransferase [Gammaproteobacteria bacterium]